MPYMPDLDTQILYSILEAIEKIEEYTDHIYDVESLDGNNQVLDASLMNFVVIGEMVAKLSEDFKNKYSDIDWNNIKSFRNIIAHNYFGIDTEEVFQIIKNDLPVLSNNIQQILGNK